MSKAPLRPPALTISTARQRESYASAYVRESLTKKKKLSMQKDVSERTGGCLCGAVRYVATGEPRWAAHCHCTTCRRSSGNAMSTYAGYPREQVLYLADRPASYASSPGVSRSFCHTCGTPIAYEGERWPDEIHLFLCTLDDPESIRPQGHVHVSEQIAWLELADGLPRHAASSDDDPPES